MEATKQSEAQKVFNEIQESVEKIKNDEPQRFPEAASPGDAFRQGDIYITRLKGIPKEAEQLENFQLQLAPGDTKGSRHCLDSYAGVEMYELENANALQGPVFKTTEERTITHPEHGDVTLPPGEYGITYQRAFDLKELRRVAD